MVQAMPPSSLSSPPARPLERLDAALGRLRRLWDSPGIKQRIWDDLGQRVEPALFRTLRAVEAEDAPGVGDIADRLHVDTSTASRLLDQAASRGFISRARHPADGRRSVIGLTVAGAELLRQATAARGRLLADLTDGWPQDDVAVLATLLDRLAESVSRLE